MQDGIKAERVKIRHILEYHGSVQSGGSFILACRNGDVVNEYFSCTAKLTLESATSAENAHLLSVDAELMRRAVGRLRGSGGVSFDVH